MDDLKTAHVNDDSDNESLVAKKRHRVRSNWIDEAEDDDEDDEFKGRACVCFGWRCYSVTGV